MGCFGQSWHRCAVPPASVNPRRTEVSDARSNRKDSPGRRPSGEELRRCFRHTRLPADLPASKALRRARRSAKSLGRSAGQGTSGNPSGGGRGCGRTCGFGVHSLLAWSCGCGRPSAADHAHTPLEKETSGVRSWSAAEGLMGPGERDGCERGAAGYRRGSGDCGGGDEGKTKAGRSVVLLRLGVGWWS